MRAGTHYSRRYLNGQIVTLKFDLFKTREQNEELERAAKRATQRILSLEYELTELRRILVTISECRDPVLQERLTQLRRSGEILLDRQ
jgi:ferritin-like protein